MNTFSGFEWLLIDLASRFGHDKLPFTDRLAWGVEMIPLFKTHNLIQLKENISPWIEKSDDPDMFSGVCIALWDAYKGVESTWQVGQDAASSGPALLSVLLNCEEGMKNTGIIGSDVPDLYLTITHNMGITEDRTKVKNATIPHVYASEAVPKAIWGSAYSEFVGAYTDTVPMAELAKNMMVNAWDSTAEYHEWDMPDGSIAHISVLNTIKKSGYPLGKHTYTYQYSEIGTKELGKRGTKSLSANHTHSYDGYMLRELNRRCNYEVTQIEDAIRLLERVVYIGKPCIELQRLGKLYKRFNQVSVVAIEYLTEDSLINLSEGYRKELLRILKEMWDYPSFEVTNIHDEFKCLPNHVHRMKFWYQELLVEAYCSTWWSDTYSVLVGEDHSYLDEEPKPEIIQQIRDAEYAIN
jgi:hypothetical protein